MGGWGTKYVWVTLAGFQEGLNLGFHNMSLGACRDSDANPRAWVSGLGKPHAQRNILPGLWT